MVVDWTINLGHILTTVGMLAAAVSVFFSLKQEIKMIQSELSHVKEAQKSLSEAFVQLGKILTQVAVQDNRLNMVEKSVDELRHGRGFISKAKQDL